MFKKLARVATFTVITALAAGTASASIFGPVNGSGWSIFGPVHGSGWGVNSAGLNGGEGWSIFGPVSGSGWTIECLFNCSGNFDLPAAVKSGVPVLVAKPHMPAMPSQLAGPALVAIHCTFSEDVMLLAKSVDDCEAAGGEVHEKVKAAPRRQIIRATELWSCK